MSIFVKNNYGKYNLIGRILDCGSRQYRFESYYLPNIYIRWYIFLLQKLVKNINKKYFYYFTSRLWTNFFKEGFLVDFIQKSYFDYFVWNWLILGSLKLNFSFLNSLQSKFIFHQILFLIFLFMININLNKYGYIFFILLMSLYFVSILLFIVFF